MQEIARASGISCYLDHATLKLHAIRLDAAEQSASGIFSASHVLALRGGPNGIIEAPWGLYAKVLRKDPAAVLNNWTISFMHRTTSIAPMRMGWCMF
jgi:2-methylcitrate dehydratase PrpD